MLVGSFLPWAPKNYRIRHYRYLYIITISTTDKMLYCSITYICIIACTHISKLVKMISICFTASAVRQVISPVVECNPWQKSSRGTCVCKMPFECGYVY